MPAESAPAVVRSLRVRVGRPLRAPFAIACLVAPLSTRTNTAPRRTRPRARGKERTPNGSERRRPRVAWHRIVRKSRRDPSVRVLVAVAGKRVSTRCKMIDLAGVAFRCGFLKSRRPVDSFIHPVRAFDRSSPAKGFLRTHTLARSNFYAFAAAGIPNSDTWTTGQTHFTRLIGFHRRCPP